MKICTNCPLSPTRTNIVPGEGSLSSKVMFIGEAPGEQEDLQGRPFIGRSGQLLRRTMERVGIDPLKVYITNTVKCRPPDNRTPTSDEVRACRLKVFAEIKRINPEIIVFVGSISMKGITGIRLKMEVGGGRIFAWKDHKCITIYHPAWILRDVKARLPILERQLSIIASEIGKQPTGLSKWA